MPLYHHHNSYTGSGYIQLWTSGMFIIAMWINLSNDSPRVGCPYIIAPPPPVPNPQLAHLIAPRLSYDVWILGHSNFRGLWECGTSLWIVMWLWGTFAWFQEGLDSFCIFYYKYQVEAMVMFTSWKFTGLIFCISVPSANGNLTQRSRLGMMKTYG